MFGGGCTGMYSGQHCRLKARGLHVRFLPLQAPASETSRVLPLRATSNRPSVGRTVPSKLGRQFHYFTVTSCSPRRQIPTLPPWSPLTRVTCGNSSCSPRRPAGRWHLCSWPRTAWQGAGSCDWCALVFIYWTTAEISQTQNSDYKTSGTISPEGLTGCYSLQAKGEPPQIHATCCTNTNNDTVIENTGFSSF